VFAVGRCRHGSSNHTGDRDGFFSVDVGAREGAGVDNGNRDSSGRLVDGQQHHVHQPNTKIFHPI